MLSRWAAVSSISLSISFAMLAACDHERTVLIDGVPRELVVTVRVDGTVVPSEWRRDRVRARITAPESAAVSIEASGPCGPVPLPIRRLEFAHENEVYSAEPAIETRRVLVDMRNAAGRTVMVGALTLDVPAGAQRAIRFPESACEEGRVLRVGGVPIGELPSDGHADVLVDLDGSHCYAVTAEELVPTILAGLPGDEGPPIVTRLAPARMHDLSPLHVDLPFQPIPEVVDRDAIGRFDDGPVFTSLVAEDCPR